MGKREINTFHEPKWDDPQTQRRFEITKQFISRTFMDRFKNVLDIGDKNPFGQHLADHFNLEYYHTNGDLDRDLSVHSVSSFDIVFCFEILEHLINPGLVIEQMINCLKSDGYIYISVPRTPKWLGWNPAHFHEFDKMRFEYILKRYQLSYKDHEKHTLWHPLRWYFHGIRPTLFRWNIGRNVTHWYCIIIDN